MERLTFEGNFCDIAQCRELPCPYNGACSQRKVWERLAAYEETGLTPERCAEFARADAEGRYIVMRDAEQEGVARLRELAEADKDGRLVVLPCKVGDGLWTFCSHPVEQVYSFTVTDISTLNGRTMLNTSRCGVVDARDVGKTVFLTREEAEKALEAMRLIDADTLWEKLDDEQWYDNADRDEIALPIVAAAPTVDAVVVTRCKDCKHLVNATVNANGFLICDISDMEIAPDDFCSYGEPKEDTC